MSEFTPHFLELIADAVHKSFWRKRALREFLRRCGISEAALATWAADESKRDFLDRTFPEVEKHAQGSKVLTKMARSLAEQTSFPDLDGWEDAELKKKQAREAVAALKNFLRAKEEETAGEKEKQETGRRVSELQQRSAERRQTLAKLAARLDQLSGEIGTQDAGYSFQDWYYDMLDYFEVPSPHPDQHPRELLIKPLYAVHQPQYELWREQTRVQHEVFVRLQEIQRKRQAVCWRGKVALYGR